MKQKKIDYVAIARAEIQRRLATVTEYEDKIRIMREFYNGLERAEISKLEKENKEIDIDALGRFMALSEERHQDRLLDTFEIDGINGKDKKNKNKI